MYILGIESSCDETAISIIERGENNRVITEKIKSQIPIHSKYGGVVPEIASRSHYEAIDILTKEALAEAGISIGDVDLIALTQGPGLIGSLLIGLSFAKGLSLTHNIPIVPVDHIHAHIEAAFIDAPENIEYPLAALVVSGGHTTIFHQKSKFEIDVVAKTRDDAVGEVMDKVAKFHGIEYPGGPVLDRIQKGGNRKRFRFTVPRINDGSGDFSFSGYKTAAMKLSKDNNITPEQEEDFRDLCASFISSLIDYLMKKTMSAVEELGVKSVIVSGGVSRNSVLREKFTEKFSAGDVKLYMPKPVYCTDNASMAAWLGYEKFIAFPDTNYFDKYLNSYSRASFSRKRARHR